jgi:hypothetical protein
MPMTMSELGMFQALKREIEELRARLDKLEDKRGPGRPPSADKKVA